VSTILCDHVSLSITRFDRLYLAATYRTLQTSGQLVSFVRERLAATPALAGAIPPIA
jgi:hypothetical protein